MYDKLRLGPDVGEAEGQGVPMKYPNFRKYNKRDIYTTARESYSRAHAGAWSLRQRHLLATLFFVYQSSHPALPLFVGCSLVNEWVELVEAER